MVDYRFSVHLPFILQPARNSLVFCLLVLYPVIDVHKSTFSKLNCKLLIQTHVLVYSLHDAEDLSDHLFHGGGPACVHGLAVALVHRHLGLADRVDQVLIPTGEYQERRLHVLHADWTLGYQGGGSRSLGRLANRIKQVLEQGIQ